MLTLLLSAANLIFHTATNPPFLYIRMNTYIYHQPYGNYGEKCFVYFLFLYNKKGTRTQEDKRRIKQNFFWRNYSLKTCKGTRLWDF